MAQHIETAPKEILGDFPRLNRAGALNLINKMEAKIAMRLKSEQQESPPPNHYQTYFSNQQQQSYPPDPHQDRHQRRTRWEQPTRDDQEKLHELMEEAGIGNFYREATEQAEPAATTPVNQPASQAPGAPQILQTHVVSSPTLATLLSNLNIPNSIVAATQNPINPFVPDAQFLQSLQLLSAAATSGPSGPTPQQIHQATQAISQQLQNFQQGQLVGSPGMMTSFTSVSSGFGSSPTTAPTGSNASASHSTEKEIASPPPASQSNLEHLPKMQREIFKRIQNMQSRKEQELTEKVEVPLDDDWYSSEEDEPEKNSKSDAPFGKFRHSTWDERGRVTSATSSAPTMSLKDVDLRSMPFGDTDFRLPPLRSGESFQDVDLRPSDSSGFKRPPAETPATEIEAGISSHAGIPWKVVEVAGVKKIDYSYLKGSPHSTSLVGVDPRLASLRISNNKMPIGPASPPPLQNVQNVVPIGIPSASDFSDPRMRKSTR